MARVQQVCLLVMLLAVLVRSDTSTSATSSSSTDTSTPTSAVTETPESTSNPSTSTSSITPSPTPSTTSTGPPPSCPDIGTVRKNNWPEDQIQLITSETAPGVTNVSWAPYVPSGDYLDASAYVDVTYNQATQEIEFIALQALAGVRDYPQTGYPTLAQLSGVCKMTCGSDSGEFQFILLVQDRNTASPIFTSPSPSVTVPETFPTGFVIPSLVISASDADADATNYELSFELSKGSPFSLTDPVKTGDLPPTYTTQLKLEKELDWSTNHSYQLIVTARDPGGLSAEATVTVTVDDVDTMQPKFEEDLYTATVEDPERVGPLAVSIKAKDEDTPGDDHLIYTLLSRPNDPFQGYFDLDSSSAELRLDKNITSLLEYYNTTVTYTIEAKENGGRGFSCRAALVINLPALMMTTTEPPTTTTPMTSTEASSTPTSVSTTTEASTTSETTPDSTTSTPVTSSISPTSSPTPTAAPLPCTLFLERQYLATTSEHFTGEVAVVSAVPEAGDVTYFLRTPGFEESFSLDETTGAISKKKKLGYQQVSLLVQAIPPGGSPKDQTTRTDIVDWDETLVVIDVADENDSPPVLNCAAYSSSCDSVVVGYPASDTATLPAPLLRLTATDGDTGDFGVDGIKYQVDSPVLQIDSSGMLYLVKEQSSTFSASITVMDNNGQDPTKSATASVQLVPVHDDQMFYVRTDTQLTDVNSVTSLLNTIANRGSYRAVFSLDFQALSAADTAASVRRLSDDQDGSTIYIYALRENDDGSIVAVGADDIEKSLNDWDSVEYIETKNDQMSGGGGDPGGDSNTGLIVAVVVLACLLVAVIIGAVLRQRQLLRRPAGNYSKQKNDAESYAGSVVNSNYSPANTRRENGVRSETTTYSNRAFQSPEQPPLSSGPGYGSEAGSLSRAAPHHDLQSTSTDLTAAAPAAAPLIDLDEPAAPHERQPGPEEPAPDYSLKSVGFKETVICVTPAEEPHDEDEDEEEEDEQEEGEQEDGQAGESVLSPDQTPADGNIDSTADGGHDENSML